MASPNTLPSNHAVYELTLVLQFLYMFCDMSSGATVKHHHVYPALLCVKVERRRLRAVRLVVVYQVNTGRGNYTGMVLSSGTVGSTLGPIIGGKISESDWRWIIFMNLPLGGLTLFVQGFFLRLKAKHNPTWSSALA